MGEHRFGRPDWPLDTGWDAGRPGQVCYELTESELQRGTTQRQTHPTVPIQSDVQILSG